MTSNSKQRADRKHKKTHEDETAVFEKDEYRILTDITPFEQNNDHTQISHEIMKFHSSFKVTCTQMLKHANKRIRCLVNMIQAHENELKLMQFGEILRFAWHIFVKLI